MPDCGSLTGTVVDTGTYFRDAVDNCVQLINEHLSSLSVQGVPLVATEVHNYDNILVFHTPSVCVVFDNAIVNKSRINKCIEYGINIVIYFYFQSLSFGNDTRPFIDPLYRLMEMFVVHWDLYGFCNGTSEGVIVTNCGLVGRHLQSDAFLTGQLNIMVPKRACRGSDHS